MPDFPRCGRIPATAQHRSLQRSRREASPDCSGRSASPPRPESTAAPFERHRVGLTQHRRPAALDPLISPGRRRQILPSAFHTSTLTSAIHPEALHVRDEAWLHRRTHGDDLPAAAERALRAAGLAWQDEAIAEGRIHDALALAPGHLAVQIAA
jgi:hypothetical protein